MATPLGLSDALLDGFVGQFYRETDGVRDLLASLHEGNPLLTLPQIVVVGQESSGKSSVLESLAMLPLFPRDEEICTRMPIHLKLRRQAATPTTDAWSASTTPKIKMRLVYSDGRETLEIFRELHEVVGQTRAWMESVVKEATGQVRGIVDHVLEIHVTSPQVPTLDLVDLPGIVGGRLPDEPTDMMEQTRALVEKYLRMPHTLVLAVAPAGERVRNSQAFQLVQHIGLTHRTIGVLTMVDRAADMSHPKGPFADVKARLDGTSGDIVELLPYGYVAVKSRDARLSDSEQLPLEAFKPHETSWLKQHLEGYVERGLASSGALAVKVATMLTHHVRESWVPLTLEQLEQQSEKIAKDLVALGKSASTLTQELSHSEASRRRKTLKALFGPSLSRVVESMDAEVGVLRRQLREKMNTRLQEMQKVSFLDGSATPSLVEITIRREAISELLSECFNATVMSTFFRLVNSVRKQMELQEFSDQDAYHTADFRNLYLLTVSAMWPKVTEMLAMRERLVDRMVATMEHSSLTKTIKIPSQRAMLKNEAKYYGATVDVVMQTLRTEHQQELVPPLLDDENLEFPRLSPSTVPASTTTSPFAPLTDDELRRLVVCITTHVVAPLTRQLMDIQAMETAAAAYVTKNPNAEASSLHWLHESSSSKRQDLINMMERLKTAQAGLAGLL